MRGGSNNIMNVQGNCLQRRYVKHGERPTKPMKRIQAAPSTDTKVTLVSQEQLNFLKAQNNPLDNKKHVSNQNVLRAGEWGPALSPPVWNTTSETFTSQNKQVQPDVQEVDQNTDQLAKLKNKQNTIKPGVKDVKIVKENTEEQFFAGGDSVFKTGCFKEINKELGTNISLFSTYEPTYNKNSKVKRSRELNVEAVLEKELSKSEYKKVILGLPSIPITDLPGCNVEDPFLRQEASKSSYDMLKLAEKSLKYFPATEEVFLVKRAPRHDNKSALSEFANEEIDRMVQESEYKDKIKILNHTLDFPEGKARDSVYGTPETHKNYDGYHLRADKLKPGKDRAATKSLIKAFRSAGLHKLKTQKEDVDKQAPRSRPPGACIQAGPQPKPPRAQTQKLCEVKIVERLDNKSSKNVNKNRKTTREIPSGQDWPKKTVSENLLPKELPLCEVPIKNRFKTLVSHDIVSKKITPSKKILKNQSTKKIKNAENPKKSYCTKELQEFSELPVKMICNKEQIQNEAQNTVLKTKISTKKILNEKIQKNIKNKKNTKKLYCTKKTIPYFDSEEIRQHHDILINDEINTNSDLDNEVTNLRCSQCFKSHFPHKRLCKPHPKFCKASFSIKGRKNRVCDNSETLKILKNRKKIKDYQVNIQEKINTLEEFLLKKT